MMGVSLQVSIFCPPGLSPKYRQSRNPTKWRTDKVLQCNTQRSPSGKRDVKDVPAPNALYWMPDSLLKSAWIQNPDKFLGVFGKNGNAKALDGEPGAGCCGRLGYHFDFICV